MGKRRAGLPGLADSFQHREGRWREDLISDARDDGSIALAARTLCQARSFWNAVHLVSRSASDSHRSI
jgi:hypothetical protein